MRFKIFHFSLFTFHLIFNAQDLKTVNREQRTTNRRFAV